MMLSLWSWLHKHLPGKPRRPLPDRLWQSLLARHHLFSFMNADEQQHLRALTQGFLDTKQFHGAQGLELTDFMMVSIAAQACLPVFRLGLDTYSDWVGVIVYPGDFVVPRELADEDGVIHQYDEEVMGEAWEHGPVIVSWQTPDHHHASTNVVIHEFAHKLDMSNGGADAWPPLPADIQPDDWAETFENAYEHFCQQVEDGLPLAMDPYAAENPAEFFAVSAEAFFESPRTFERAYPALYRLLSRLFGLNPLKSASAP